MSDPQINWFECYQTINGSPFVVIGGLWCNRSAWAQYNPKIDGVLETVTKLRKGIESALMDPDAPCPSGITLCWIIWNPTLEY